MLKDFYEATEETVRGLNQTERGLFDFVVKNMDVVKGMSIQKFAAERFISTTTVFRFTQKLGFSGYADFINSLLVTTHAKQDTVLPKPIIKSGYGEAYLKNAVETVRVMSLEGIKNVINILSKKPNIYVLTDDNTHTIGQYCERLFIGLGFHAYFPETAYQMKNLINRIGNGDMLLALSYSGEDSKLLDFIERVFIEDKPYLMSITRADNNPLESLSDTNFYIFTDEVKISGLDVTSSVAMLMILELIVYEYLSINPDDVTLLPKT